MKQLLPKFLKGSKGYSLKTVNILSQLNQLAKQTGNNSFNAGRADGFWGPNTEKAFNNALKEGLIDQDGNLKKSSGFSLSNLFSVFKSKDKPTREEYIEKKLIERRKQAADINAKSPVPNLVLGVFQPGHDFDYYGKKLMNDEQIVKMFTGYKKDLEKYISRHGSKLPKESLDQAQRVLNYYNEVIKNPRITKSKGIGLSCINTATGGFGSGNTFASNKQLYTLSKAGKTNYEVLPWDETKLQVGDIIQVGDGVHRDPHHSVQVTGFNIFGIPLVTQAHADTAGMEDKDANSAIDFLNIWARKFDKNLGLSILRYKGSKAELNQWNKEYETI